jgi:hypothetical protein
MGDIAVARCGERDDALGLGGQGMLQFPASGRIA